MAPTNERAKFVAASADVRSEEPVAFRPSSSVVETTTCDARRQLIDLTQEVVQDRQTQWRLSGCLKNTLVGLEEVDMTVPRSGDASLL
jgi:hypothetical protein